MRRWGLLALLGLVACEGTTMGRVRGIELGMQPAGTSVDVVRVLEEYNRALERKDAGALLEVLWPSSVRRYDDVLRHTREASDPMLEALPAWTAELVRRLRDELDEDTLAQLDGVGLLAWLVERGGHGVPPHLDGVVRHVAMENTDRAVVTLSTHFKHGDFYEVAVVRETSDWLVELPAPATVP